MRTCLSVLPVWLGVTIACIATLATISAAQDASTPKGTVYKFGEWRLECCLVPDKSVIMLGEPINVKFQIINLTDEDLHITTGGESRNRLGRPEDYSIIAADDKGKKVRRPDAGGTMGGIVGPELIPARGQWERKLFLPNWAGFRKVGRYRLTCERVCRISKRNPKQFFVHWKYVEVKVRVCASLKVVTPTTEGIGRIIESYGRMLLDKDAWVAIRAARVLAEIHDQRVCSHFLALFKGGTGQDGDCENYEPKREALCAMADFTKEDALEILERGMTEQHVDLRVVTALSLSRNKHPKTRKLLCSMCNDKEPCVRAAVAGALALDGSDEAIHHLREMTRDEVEYVRDKAKRQLEALAKKRR